MTDTGRSALAVRIAPLAAAAVSFDPVQQQQPAPERLGPAQPLPSDSTQPAGIRNCQHAPDINDPEDGGPAGPPSRPHHAVSLDRHIPVGDLEPVLSSLCGHPP